MKAIIYTRFSPRPDASTSESCEWQEAECLQFAHKNGFEVRATFKDPDKSGADAVRPTLWEAISALKKGDALLVWKWDRLARDLLLALQIERAVEQRGATVVATTGDTPGSDPHAAFTRHILMAVAELERKMISQRTSASMKALQRSGRRMSAIVPYGWKVDPNNPKRIVEEDHEQEVLRKMVEMRESGMTVYAIRKQLNKSGMLARNGKEWEFTSVRNILRRV